MRSLRILCSLLAFAAGCAGPGDGDSSARERDPSEYQKAACSYETDDGEQPLARAGSEPGATRVNFGKRLDFSRFEPVLRASATETIRFVEARGDLRVFRIDDSMSRCNMFDAVPVAPGDLLSYWARATAGGLAGQGMLVGMYVEKRSPEVASSAETALIGVRRDGNRWVLVHEYLHHLFQVARQGEGLAALKRRVLALTEELDRRAAAFEEGGEESGELRPWVETYVETYWALKDLLLRLPLEEMTIEALLQKELEMGRLAYVPFGRRSSDGYIRHSAGRARELLEPLRRMADRLRERLAREEWPELARRLDEAEADSAATLAELQALAPVSAARRPRRENRDRERPELFALETDDGTAPLPCGRGRELDEVVEALGRLSGRNTRPAAQFPR